MAERFHELFRGFDGAHGTHGDPPVKEPSGKWPIKPVARTHKKPVTVELVERHLSGDYPLGVVPVRPGGSVVWGSIDIDDYQLDLFRVVAAVEAARLPLMPVRSKSGGLHLFVFCEPKPAAEVRRWLDAAKGLLGFPNAEVFPKQDDLDPVRDAGSWILLPYFGGTFGGKLQEQVGLKPGGGTMALPEFLRRAETMRLPPGDMPVLRAKAKGRSPVAGGEPQLPPCLAAVVRDGWGEGGRNEILMQYGIFAKRAFPGEWAARIEAFNANFDPVMTAEEVAATIQSLRKKEYEYLCKHEPMRSLCNQPVCALLPFGVGGGPSFNIEAVVKIPGETKRYRLTIDGRTMEVGPSELNSFPRFNEAAIGQLDRSFRPMRAGDFSAIVDAVLNDPARCTTAELPVDLKAGAEFRELLSDFLTNMAKGQRREDIMAGRPWEDPGITEAEAEALSEKRGKHVAPRVASHYFRLMDLMRFLEREKSKLTRNEVAQAIGAIGGENWRLRIPVDGPTRAVWRVPPDAIEPPPPSMEAASLPEEEI